MCELFAVSSSGNLQLNSYLKTFFSHSDQNPNGWGLALLDHDNISLEKEPAHAARSQYLKNRLAAPIESARAMAHIRMATKGHVDYLNTHPFVHEDISGRKWVLMHNGTMFQTDLITRFHYPTQGTTDSEWILFYILDRINKALENTDQHLDEASRIAVVNAAILDLAPGNKLNLIIYDGDLFYVHKNMEGTLYRKPLEGAQIFATVPLDHTLWTELPQNQLQIYRDGMLLLTCDRHPHSYVYNEEHYRYLYTDFSEL